MSAIVTTACTLTACPNEVLSFCINSKSMSMALFLSFGIANKIAATAPNDNQNPGVKIAQGLHAKTKNNAQNQMSKACRILPRYSPNDVIPTIIIVLCAGI